MVSRGKLKLISRITIPKSRMAGPESNYGIKALINTKFLRTINYPYPEKHPRGQAAVRVAGRPEAYRIPLKTSAAPLSRSRRVSY